MKKVGLLFSILMSVLLLTGCNKTIPQSPDTIAFNQLKETFTGNIIDGTIAEKILEVGVGLENEVVDITGDYTLYYNDEFGFATVLCEEWKGYSIGVQRIEDDFEYNGEVIKIKRPMILFGTPMDENEYKDLFLMKFYHYGFNIVSNEDIEKKKTQPDVWNTYKNDYKGENGMYSFFEASTPRHGSQRYLLETFPNLDCRTWTGGIEYDIEGNPHEYLDADCNGYEVIDGEAIKTRKSWVEQLFPIGFLFYDI